MTIVIPYKDDILSGTELKFALRSIDKYLTGFTNLVIIGTPPDWYKGHYLTAKDYDGRKQYSIYSKLLLFCGAIFKDGDWVREDDFVMWNDDHFLLRPLSVNNILAWHNGKLSDTVKGNHGGRYREAIANTLQIMPDAINFDIHTPCIYNKSTFKMLFCNKTEEVCIKSYYFYHIGCEVAQMNDLKIQRLWSKEAIKELIKDRLFFSTSTNGMKKPMIELMNELYPNKSQWEK